ncbi:MAG: VWA domain-containing protein [Chloroflexi bacterium]|nr:MAG: VWA domain-containing protein [Chloroflexota bacterium]
MSDERLRRWRLLLGGGAADGTGCALGAADANVDQVLAALYEDGGERSAGLGASAPNVARWLGDIRTYFPASVVRVMQRDALDRLGLRQMLLEPELLSRVEPDVHLVATLIGLSSVIPARTRETARQVVRGVVEDLERRLANPLRSAVQGSLDRSVRNRRPRHAEIDWNRTIRANLKHYQPQYGTVIPEHLVGWGRRRRALKDVILAIDQSGSMAESVVYSGVLGAVMASLPAVRTRLVVFDTSVVDLTDQLADPVDLLFGVRLGGGTDIGRALEYCQGLVTRPADTVLVLISDLHENGPRARLLKRAAGLVGAGVRFVALLALSDQGRPGYDHDTAAALHELGVPAFACTPDLFPELMAAALSGRDLNQWAAARELV